MNLVAGEGASARLLVRIQVNTKLTTDGQNWRACAPNHGSIWTFNASDGLKRYLRKIQSTT